MKNIGFLSVTGEITWEAKVQNQKVGSCHGENVLQVDFYAVCFKPENVFVCSVLIHFHIAMRHFKVINFG